MKKLILIAALALASWAIVLGAVFAGASAAAQPYHPDTIITGSHPGEGVQYVVEFTAGNINSANYPIEFQCRVDGGEWYACGHPEQGLPTYEYLNGLAPGNHIFRVRTLFRGAVDNTPATLKFTL